MKSNANVRSCHRTVSSVTCSLMQGSSTTCLAGQVCSNRTDTTEVRQLRFRKLLAERSSKQVDFVDRPGHSTYNPLFQSARPQSVHGNISGRVYNMVCRFDLGCSNLAAVLKQRRCCTAYQMARVLPLQLGLTSWKQLGKVKNHCRS